MEAHLNRLDFESFCTRSWGIWKDRSKFTHNHKEEIRLVNFTKFGLWTDNNLHEFRNTRKISNIEGMSLLKKYSLDQGSTTSRALSIFVDAAFCDQSLSYATGLDIFNPEGVMVAVGHRSIQPPGSIMAAELQAIHHGVQFGISNTEGPWRIF